MLAALTAAAVMSQTSASALANLPVRGLHISAPDHSQIAECADFIRNALPTQGVNTLIVEFDYNYQFKTHPEVANPGALSLADVQALAAACKDAHVQLIPEMDLLGHQSWAETTFGLLRSHPEFDETRGKYPGNKGIYCRSYCPLAPGLHPLLFDLMDELTQACGATAFHVGMDEVMILADKDCPRCSGKNTADLFAGEVTALDDHLKSKGVQMWMWGDRFIDGRSTGIGDWEASGNNTEAAIDKVPKDVVICDWHYDNAEPTPLYFAIKGFKVMPCFWRNVGVGTAYRDMVLNNRLHANPEIGTKLTGLLQSTWMSFDDFDKAYYGKGGSRQAQQCVKCFKTVFPPHGS